MTIDLFIAVPELKNDNSSKHLQQSRLFASSRGRLCKEDNLNAALKAAQEWHHLMAHLLSWNRILRSSPEAGLAHYEEELDNRSGLIQVRDFSGLNVAVVAELKICLWGDVPAATGQRIKWTRLEKGLLDRRLLWILMTFWYIQSRATVLQDLGHLACLALDKVLALCK